MCAQQPSRTLRFLSLHSHIRLFIIVLLVGFLIVYSKGIPRWMTVYLAAVSAATFIAYGYDKSLARRQKFRVSEWALHAWSLAGGTLGAVAGQSVFRHKINKFGFQVIFDIILLAQIAAIYWFFVRGS